MIKEMLYILKIQVSNSAYITVFLFSFLGMGAVSFELGKIQV